MDLQKKIHKIECYHLHLQYKWINKQTQLHKKEKFAKVSYLLDRANKDLRLF